MNSYFNAGYHDWQASELHHHFHHHHSHHQTPTNRLCASPDYALNSASSSSTNTPPTSLSSSSTSSQQAANIFYDGYAAAAYLHHPNSSPTAPTTAPSPVAAAAQLNYSNNLGGYGSATSTTAAHRYPPPSSATIESSMSVRSMFRNYPHHAQHQGNFYGDPHIFNNLSVSAAYAHTNHSSLEQSQALSCVAENRRDVSPGCGEGGGGQLGGREEKNNGSVGSNEGHGLYAPSSCSNGSFEARGGSPSLCKALGTPDQPATPYEQGDDVSPSSTPERMSHENGTRSALAPPTPSSSSSSGKAFFPWMKSYTGKLSSNCCLCSQSINRILRLKHSIKFPF